MLLKLLLGWLLGGLRVGHRVASLLRMRRVVLNDGGVPRRLVVLGVVDELSARRAPGSQTKVR